MCDRVSEFEHEKHDANDYAQLIAQARETLHKLCLAIDGSLHPLQMTLVKFIEFLVIFHIGSCKWRHIFVYN
jgi:hypothetical protein